MFIDITDIYLFDQIRDMTCVEIRLRCSWKLLVLILFDLNVVWHVPMLGSDVY